MNAKTIYETGYKPFNKMSDVELKQYIKNTKSDIKQINAKTIQLKKQIEKDRIRNAELKGEIKVLKEKNAKELKRLGWEDLTDDELTWLQNEGYEKYWKTQYFIKKPSARTIKAKYAEVHGLEVDNTLDKKFEANPEMEQKSGWIDKAGQYYSVGFAEHEEWAWKYLNKKFGHINADERISKTQFKEAHVYLEESGWVRIMAWPSVKVHFIIPLNLTHAQKQTLYKYCKLHNEPLPFDDSLFK